MKTSLTTIKDLKMSLKVELDIADFNKKVASELKTIAAKASIDGFRKGKAPLSVINSKFGEEARSKATNDLISENLSKSLIDSKVNPATQPNLVAVDTKDDAFVYTVEFEVFPEVAVADFSKLKITQIKVKINKEDEGKTLEGLTEKLTEYKPVKRASKNGDKLIIDFKGMLDGKVFEGGEASNFEVILGKKTMIKGFEEGLIGVSAGKELDLDLQFPKQYHVEDLAGKDVVFAIKVVTVNAAKKPKLDDKFAEQFNEKTFSDLTKSIKDRMQQEADVRVDEHNKGAVFNALLDANKFDLPQGLIDNEAQALLAKTQERIKQQGMPEDKKLTTADFNNQAGRRVQLSLLADKIAIDNKLEASEKQTSEKLEEVAKSYGDDYDKVISWYNEDKSRMSGIKSLVVEKIMIEMILQQAQVTHEDKKFHEIASH